MSSPNILFVFADQLRSHAVGCYGNDQVNTPNMDRLAAEGVRFTQAISTHPVCGPYRGMLMTGNYPMKNGMVQTDHFLRNPDPCFSEVCRAAGYRTGYVGKWHLDGYDREGHIPPERRLGFDYWRTLECTHDYFESKYYRQDEKTPRVWEGYDAIAQTEAACDFIRRESESPFCLFLSWGPPHGPYQAPPEYMDRFPPDRIKLRANVDDFESSEKFWSMSDSVLPEKWNRMRDTHRRLLDDPSNQAIRERYRGYYAAVEALDDCLGELLGVLKETGQLDDTIVVFTSDHGDNLGSHRQMGKQLPFEESISIPCMIRYPAKIAARSTTDVLFTPVDVMPTLLSLTGLDCHEVDGRDVGEVIQGQREDPRDAVLIQKCIALSTNWITNGNGPWCGVRTKRHTYARLSGSKKPWMLYDNQSDPFQLNNLIDNPNDSDVRERLDRRTDELLQEAGETDDPTVYAELIQKERNARGMPERWHELNPERHVSRG